MGTRGYIVIQFENIYYCIYNQFDSYPSHLGKKIIEVLEMEEIKKNLDYVCYIINSFLTRNEPIINRRQLYIYNRQQLFYDEIMSDIWVEWIYTINLDNETFSFKGGYYEPTYPLNDIPPNWFEKFEIENDRLELETKF